MRPKVDTRAMSTGVRATLEMELPKKGEAPKLRLMCEYDGVTRETLIHMPTIFHRISLPLRPNFIINDYW